MAGKGRPLSETQIRTIINLLASTDMEISAIAERMKCSRSVVVTINRREGIRLYSGKRCSWTVAMQNDLQKTMRVL